MSSTTRLFSSPSRLRRGKRTAISLSLAAMIVAGCSAATITPNPTGSAPATPTATASESHSASPTPGELQMAMGNQPLAAPAQDSGTQAATALNDFGFDLLRKLDAKGNLVASPASIALALGMVRPGARGVTATEMDKVLHSFGADGQSSEISALLAEFARQTVTLDSNGMPLASPDPSKDPAVELDVADQAFIEKTLSVEQPYLDSLSSTYNAGVALVDYKGNSEAARLLINKWASDRTKGRIPNILGQGDVDSMTRLVLVNAIYLKAAWDTEFDPKLTTNRSFTTADGASVNVPTMAIDANYAYAEGAGYKAIDLPYSLNGMAMTVVVPDDIAAFTNSLTDKSLESIIRAESEAEVDFQLPKFSIATSVELSNVLSALGMKDAFDPNSADFSGITTQEPLYVSKVIHQANIDVVEKGTTASAVTAVVMAAGAAPAQPKKVTLHVDKPFLYFIRDARNGAVLFMGRVADPSSK